MYLMVNPVMSNTAMSNTAVSNTAVSAYNGQMLNPDTNLLIHKLVINPVTQL